MALLTPQIYLFRTLDINFNLFSIKFKVVFSYSFKIKYGKNKIEKYQK